MNNDYLKETRALNNQSSQKAGTSVNAAPNMNNMSYGSPLEEVKKQNTQLAANAKNSMTNMNNAYMNNSVTNNAMNSSAAISNDANVLAQVKQENAKSAMNKQELK